VFRTTRLQFRVHCGLLEERSFTSTPAPTYSSAPSQSLVEANLLAKRGRNLPRLVPSLEMLSTYSHEVTGCSWSGCRKSITNVDVWYCLRARGFLQYNFNKAKNIFAGMVQTESPYYQPTPKAPAPFEKAVGRFPGDPKYQCDGKDFDGCDTPGLS
jgi:hypothetical protein